MAALSYGSSTNVPNKVTQRARRLSAQPMPRYGCV
jgi:hypothetical protein